MLMVLMGTNVTVLIFQCTMRIIALVAWLAQLFSFSSYHPVEVEPSGEKNTLYQRISFGYPLKQDIIRS